MQSGQKKKLYKWNPEKPYYFFGDYLWSKYGCRVLKLPVDAGFTCPNRDGSISSKGCIFCSEGSASPTVFISSDIKEQMRNARNSFRRSDAETKYIAYFQAFTNTYAETNVLEELYSTAVSEQDITGLMIATRPDCLPEDVVNLISSFNRENFELHLEIGMQSIHERSLDFLNRGHTYKDTRDAILRAAEKNISVCVHVILGIPGESWRDMMDTAEEISSLPVTGVKIHHLHVIKDTILEKYYNEGKVPVMEFREYISIVCDFLERLRPDILIHRLIGDVNIKALVAPMWANHKGTVLQAIEDEFVQRCTIQGFLVR
ncbi:MAG: TIGR01212 family radical SAM protein [Spirochaetes bacterium]|nr:TIGR01212 family radical SAM protein [Spirochaetota bacterium]